MGFHLHLGINHSLHRRQTSAPFSSLMAPTRRVKVILLCSPFSHILHHLGSLRFNLVIFPKQSLSPPLSPPLRSLSPSPHLSTMFAIFLSQTSDTFFFSLSLSTCLSKAILSHCTSVFLFSLPPAFLLSTLHVSLSSLLQVSFKSEPCPPLNLLHVLFRPQLPSHIIITFSFPCSAFLSLPERSEQPRELMGFNQFCQPLSPSRRVMEASAHRCRHLFVTGEPGPTGRFLEPRLRREQQLCLDQTLHQSCIRQV